MKEKNVHINVDNLGQVVVTFNDGTTIILTENGNKKYRGFKIRSIEDVFSVRMSGAVNVLDIETRRSWE